MKRSSLLLWKLSAVVPFKYFGISWWFQWWRWKYCCFVVQQQLTVSNNDDEGDDAENDGEDEEIGSFSNNPDIITSTCSFMNWIFQTIPQKWLNIYNYILLFKVLTFSPMFSTRKKLSNSIFFRFLFPRSKEEAASRPAASNESSFWLKVARLAQDANFLFLFLLKVTKSF